LPQKVTVAAMSNVRASAEKFPGEVTEKKDQKMAKNPKNNKKD